MRIRLPGDSQGFTLIEALLAILLLSIALLGMFTLLHSIMGYNKLAETISTATTHAQDKMEALKTLRFTHANLDTDPAVNPHTEASPPANYTIAWTVTGDPTVPPLPNVKVIAVTVSWNWKGNRSVTLRTIIKN